MGSTTIVVVVVVVVVVDNDVDKPSETSRRGCEGLLVEEEDAHSRGQTKREDQAMYRSV